VDVPQIWHGIEQIAFSSLGLNPNGGDTAEIVISQGGAVAFEQSTPTSESITWDTTTVANGNYTLTLNVLNASGVSLGQVS
jgi:hypothetical protein